MKWILVCLLCLPWQKTKAQSGFFQDLRQDAIWLENGLNIKGENFAHLIVNQKLKDTIVNGFLFEKRKQIRFSDSRVLLDSTFIYWREDAKGLNALDKEFRIIHQWLWDTSLSNLAILNGAQIRLSSSIYNTGNAQMLRLQNKADSTQFILYNLNFGRMELWQTHHYQCRRIFSEHFTQFARAWLSNTGFTPKWSFERNDCFQAIMSERFIDVGAEKDTAQHRMLFEAVYKSDTIVDGYPAINIGVSRTFLEEGTKEILGDVQALNLDSMRLFSSQQLIFNRTSFPIAAIMGNDDKKADLYLFNPFDIHDDLSQFAIVLLFNKSNQLGQLSFTELRFLSTSNMVAFTAPDFFPVAMAMPQNHSIEYAYIKMRNQSYGQPYKIKYPADKPVLKTISCIQKQLVLELILPQSASIGIKINNDKTETAQTLLFDKKLKKGTHVLSFNLSDIDYNQVNNLYISISNSKGHRFIHKEFLTYP